MSTFLYGRQYRCIIETYRGTSIEIPDLKWTFRIEKNISQIYQFGEVVIYNLSPDTETDIFKNGKALTIEAGYENGPYGTIFKGPIRQPIRGKDDDAVTYYLKLVCIDGDDALNLGFANFVLANGQTAQSIANQVCRSSSIPFDIHIDSSIDQQITQRGKAVFGNPGDTLRSIAINNNANYYVDDGVHTISPLSKAPPPIVPEFNAQTGMIGIPHQVEQGVQVRTLINPNIRLDSWFKLNNQDIIQAQLDLGQLQTLLDMDGVYRVIEMVITGDTRGNDWYYDITGISQTGQLPFMLTGGSQSGM